MAPRITRDTRSLYEINQMRFSRIVRFGAIALAVLLAGWFFVIAHFVWKFW